MRPLCSERFSDQSRTSGDHKRFSLAMMRPYLHARVTALVRDVEPAHWNDKDWFISAEADETYAAIAAMIARLRGEPTATENQ
jgi:hypothetical protein